MKVLVIYDSNFGNTKFIADVIAHEMDGETKVFSVSESSAVSFDHIDLLIVGSPIVGWKPTEKCRHF
jgi:menaquinone-dependent protoporphyrinogen IX oxidase